jgi:branched-subunit amino acid aminotransferase/4-amino-4-deoxychorismate lyase
MSVNGDFYRFDSDRFVKVDYAIAEQLTVADSFLVENGSVRAIQKHFERFRSSIKSPAGIDFDAFAKAVTELVPREGAWFPRLEYREFQPIGEQFFLRLREAPERTETLTLWSLDEPDPRVSPSIKGPDLSLCQKLRRKANLHGADEAVILSPEGFVADGALSAIMWWEDEVLCAPDDSTNWLPSITRELVLEIAQQAGFRVKPKTARPEDLAGCEVWSLSGLQGIRAATAWQGVPISQPKRHQSFRKRLSLISEKL